MNQRRKKYCNLGKYRIPENFQLAIFAESFTEEF